MTQDVPQDNIPRDARIWVTGHRGLVGSALVRRLRNEGFTNLLTATRAEVDLCDPAAVDDWFASRRPEFVFHAAGKVGGIQANAAQPADFLYENLMIHATVLRAAWKHETRKLLYLGSACVYPRDCPQPIREEYLLTGPLEETNEGYALAKITGLKSCEAYRRQHGCDFISAMPTNLYGPGDNFDPRSSHVLPALIRKFHEAKLSGAKQVVVWGSGEPRRDLLHVDDLADACLFLMKHYDRPETINIGTGADVRIADLADLVREAVYPQAEIVYDREKPDGTPRKLVGVGRLHNLGWRHTIDLRQGIRQTYRWFRERLEAGDERIEAG